MTVEYLQWFMHHVVLTLVANAWMKHNLVKVLITSAAKCLEVMVIFSVKLLWNNIFLFKEYLASVQI